ncbi:MAG: LptF/LptG family permease [Kiritimatiellae bacterium]|nr:LptF/LptG family permease [Kiritimatiellia bacterium]
MRIVTRHLLHEFLLNLFYCVAAFLTMFILIDIFAHISDLVSSGVVFSKLLLYYGSIILEALDSLLPAALLMSTLYTFWQLSRSNEVTAMRASGISIFQIMLPFILVGLFFSVTTLVIKETVTPKAVFWADAFKKNDFKPLDKVLYGNQAFVNSRDGRVWQITEFDLKKPNYLKGVKITTERPDGSSIYDINAVEGFYMDKQWWLTGVQVQNYDKNNNPIGKLIPIKSDPDNIRQFSELTEEAAVFSTGVKGWENFSARDIIRYMKYNPNMSDVNRASRTFDIHTRLAMPWGCLIVVILGIPTGVQGGRRNALTGIIMAIGLFFSFYAFSQVGIFLGKREIVSPVVGAWLPNIVFFCFGTVMVWRAR